ncbi:MAG: triose-phosphate isomerase, partial [Thermoleophilia bacterium]|nr:triose-phosphate isomerase [Thermoleophilia bacterium]
MAGETHAVLTRQVRQDLDGLPVEDAPRTVIAYEPVWAIGTGRTATPEMAQEAISFIRDQLTTLWGAAPAAQVRILYGGSVGPENIDALMA